MDGVVVESFTLDHTKVKAPFVRSCGQIATPKGDLILKFDLRFTQPNVEIMPTNAVHALEHLLAGFMREELDGIVTSRHGCRTGLPIKVGGHRGAEGCPVNALKKVLQASEVPAANEVQVATTGTCPGRGPKVCEEGVGAL